MSQNLHILLMKICADLPPAFINNTLPIWITPLFLQGNKEILNPTYFYDVSEISTLINKGGVWGGASQYVVFVNGAWIAGHKSFL